ncbi:REST corepressor [Gryllus bimaculatus]|nr:REST corepressor [Gryllus bimaculatus]
MSARTSNVSCHAHQQLDFTAYRSSVRDNQMTDLRSSNKHRHTNASQPGFPSKPVGWKLVDKEFDPPVEMMVNDFDDERTLDEEEALECQEDPQTELSNLQREGDMPLEELLAMYGYGDPTAENMQSSSSEEMSNHELTIENDDMSREMLGEDEEKSDHAELRQLYSPEKGTEENAGTSRLLRLSRPQSEEEEDDYDYSPDEEEWRKTIMVGSDYQAGIPEGLCKYDDALPYENEDKLLWNPANLSEKDVEEFLVKAQESLVNNPQGVHAIPTGAHTRDDEQALYLLLQCGYNVEEALRRRRMNVVPPTDTMSLWSEEECRNFENGLRNYGKDFHLIQQNKVRTRSVGELVQFYYLWKKTERHDIFANKARLEKKKYTLHPGITDYMDRFLEEQESGAVSHNRDRSSSPNINCLIYGDPKRHRVPEASDETPYNVDSFCDLASTLGKEGFQSLVNLTAQAGGMEGVSSRSDNDENTGGAVEGPPLNSVEMAFSSTTVTDSSVMNTSTTDSDLPQSTEPIA